MPLVSGEFRVTDPLFGSARPFRRVRSVRPLAGLAPPFTHCGRPGNIIKNAPDYLTLCFHTSLTRSHYWRHSSRRACLGLLLALALLLLPGHARITLNKCRVIYWFRQVLGYLFTAELTGGQRDGQSERVSAFYLSKIFMVIKEELPTSADLLSIHHGHVRTGVLLGRGWRGRCVSKETIIKYLNKNVSWPITGSSGRIL